MLARKVRVRRVNLELRNPEAASLLRGLFPALGARSWRFAIIRLLWRVSGVLRAFRRVLSRCFGGAHLEAPERELAAGLERSEGRDGAARAAERLERQHGAGARERALETPYELPPSVEGVRGSSL